MIDGQWTALPPFGSLFRWPIRIKATQVAGKCEVVLVQLQRLPMKDWRISFLLRFELFDHSMRQRPLLPPSVLTEGIVMASLYGRIDLV